MGSVIVTYESRLRERIDWAPGCLSSFPPCPLCAKTFPFMISFIFSFFLSYKLASRSVAFSKDETDTFGVVPLGEQARVTAEREEEEGHVSEDVDFGKQGIR